MIIHICNRCGNKQENPSITMNGLEINCDECCLSEDIIDGVCRLCIDEKFAASPFSAVMTISWNKGKTYLWDGRLTGRKGREIEYLPYDVSLEEIEKLLCLI